MGTWKRFFKKKVLHTTRKTF